MDSHNHSHNQGNIIGKKYVDAKHEEINADYLSKVNLIGLFFTGSWCPPCEKFALELIEVYNDANAKDKILEIIQVSNEKNEKEFVDGMANKPWIAVQYNDNFIDYLVNEFKINFLPVLIIVTKDKNIVSDTGRRDIAEFGVKSHEKWLRTYKVQKDREKELANLHS